jgi:hypothetical protein
MGKKFGWFVPAWFDTFALIINKARSALPIVPGADGPQPAIASDGGADPLAWFAGMIDHCYDFAQAARAEGRPIVGIMCEFRSVFAAARRRPSPRRSSFCRPMSVR